MTQGINLKPIVSKFFCSPSTAVFMVRNRPDVINGGGFVVTDSRFNVVFKVDGCGMLGTKEEIILRNGDGAAILFIRKKGGIIQALSVHRTWIGYLTDYEGAEQKVFSVKEPKSGCVISSVIRVSVEPKRGKDWDFEVVGSFTERDCSIADNRGNTVAQVAYRRVQTHNQD